MDIIWAGIISAIAMIFLLMKLDIRKVCGYDIFIDVFFTFLLAYMFSGTYSGMMAAIIGGAVLSIFLFIMKKQFGYMRLVRNRYKLEWRYFPPSAH